MKIYKITEASEYLGVSIGTLKTLANNGKVKSFKTTGEQLKKAIHERIEAERQMTKHGNKLYHMQSRLKMLEHQKNTQKTQ